MSSDFFSYRKIKTWCFKELENLDIGGENTFDITSSIDEHGNLFLVDCFPVLAGCKVYYCPRFIITDF